MGIYGDYVPRNCHFRTESYTAIKPQLFVTRNDEGEPIDIKCTGSILTIPYFGIIALGLLRDCVRCPLRIPNYKFKLPNQNSQSV